MTDRFDDGVQSIISVLRPKNSGWQEMPDAHAFTGYPSRAFWFLPRNLVVISAVETVKDLGQADKGPEYHISISKPHRNGAKRCDSNEAKWVLDQFGLDGAEEDNHVPGGKVRNFWRTVATGLIGMECACKAEEPAMVEDKGDFVWRGVTDGR